MPTESRPSHVSGWTIETYAAYNEAQRKGEERFQSERDRRYTELGIEREKALAIQKQADLAALELAREIQTYKDEKANELRSQIERERGSYASKDDLKAAVEKLEEALKPIQEFVSVARGSNRGAASVITYIFGAIAAIASIIAVVAFFSRGAPASSVVYVPSPPGTLLPSVPPQPAPR